MAFFLCSALPSHPESVASRAPRLRSLSLGFGTWTSYSPAADVSAGETLFSLPSLSLGFSGYGLTGQAASAMRWSVNGASDKRRLAVGDLELSVGKKLGHVRPRLGADIPTGYDWSRYDKSEPWIGSGNLFLRLGLAAGSPRGLLPWGLQLGGDLEMAAAATDAMARRGSWRLDGGMGLSGSPANGVRLGANSLLLYTFWDWNSEYDQRVFKWVPGASAEYAFPAFSGLNTVSLKAGHTALVYDRERYRNDGHWRKTPQATPRAFYLSLGFSRFY